ncbi:MAG: hypothetical protein S4CHLAM81_07370 [Chlamydiales bacterium]|nr:hypothetical protein [Chlamydiales bacterium]MCH9635521.1 hypothetical protein [Chlamydiales bacterium]
MAADLQPIYPVQRQRLDKGMSMPFTLVITATALGALAAFVTRTYAGVPVGGTIGIVAAGTTIGLLLALAIILGNKVIESNQFD